MKFVCDACERLVEPGGFRVEGAALYLLCPRCQAESRLAPAPNAAAEAALPNPTPASRPVVVPFAPRPAPPPQEPDTEAEAEVAVAVVPASERCPKCAEPKMGRIDCSRCGLVFELYNPEELAIPNSARREFAELLESGDLKSLDFIGTEQLAHLARLSRHHLADFPGDARATALLEKLTARSLALAAAAKPEPSTPVAGNRQALLFALLFLVVVTATALLFSALHN